jgi:flagellar biosynthesis protein FlhA
MVIEKLKEQNPDEIYERLGVDILSVQLASNLYEASSDEINEKFLKYRDKIVDSYGYILPIMKVVENSSLQSNNFVFSVRGKNIFTGETKGVIANDVFVILQKIIFEYADKIIVRTDILKLLELVEYNDGGLTPELLSKITVEDIREIYVNLLSEKINVKDVLLLFERLNYFTQTTKDISKLTEMLKTVL